MCLFVVCVRVFVCQVVSHFANFNVNVVKIVRLKVYIIFSQSDDLDLHSRLPLRLKLDNS